MRNEANSDAIKSMIQACNPAKCRATDGLRPIRHNALRENSAP